MGDSGANGDLDGGHDGDGGSQPSPAEGAHQDSSVSENVQTGVCDSSSSSYDVLTYSLEMFVGIMLLCVCPPFVCWVVYSPMV